MPGTLRDKYKVADVKAGKDLAGTILYGFFGNAATPDEKRRLLKDINYIHLASDANVSTGNMTSVYTVNELPEINESRYTLQGKAPIEHPRNNMVDDDAYTYYTNDAVENTLERYHRGMQGLFEFLKENEHKIEFQSDLERDYYYMLRQQVEILADGESLCQKSIDDNTYEYSKMLSSSLNLATGSFDYDTNRDIVTVKVTEPEVGTHELFERVKDTGLIQAAVGAAALSNKYDQFVKDGSVGRGEIIEETKLQIARMKKLAEMDEDTYSSLYEDKILNKSQKDLNEGDRRLQRFLWDQEAKLDLLTSGWPVQDIPAISKLHIVARDAYKKYTEADEAYEKAVEANPNPTEEQKTHINDLKVKRDNYKKVSDALTTFWTDAKKNYKMTENDRRRMLQNVDSKLSQIEEQYKPRNLNSVIYGARKCLDRPLENHEKILMAGSIREIYDIIDDDDPMLMRSSSEFRAMKKSLEKLSNLDPNDEEHFKEYDRQHDETVRLMGKYLSYKHMQLNDPKNNHVRSEREAKRIRDVEAAVYRLKSHTPRAKETLKNSDVILNPNKRLMESPARTEYEKFIKQHTGYHQIYGPGEDLADHVAMVMAVTEGKDRYQNGPLPLEEIENSARQLKDKYKLERAEKPKMAQALAEPDTIMTIKETNFKDLYGMKGITKNAERYKDFIADIRVLYKNMLDKEGQPEEYQKIFEAVHEMSVLPYMNVEKINVDEVNKTIAEQTKIIMDNADKFLMTNYGKSPAGRAVLDSIATLKLHNQACENNELSQYILDIVKRTNKKRGISDNIDNPNAIDLEDDYGPEAIRSIRRHEQDHEDIRPKDAVKEAQVQKRYINKDYNNNQEKSNIIGDEFEGLEGSNEIKIIKEDEKVRKTNFDNMIIKQNEEKSEKMDPEKRKIKEAAKKREEFEICTDSNLLQDRSESEISLSLK